MSSLNYISIEGLEGAGKSTATKTIEEFFSNRDVFHAREPGGTLFAEDLRKIVKDEEGVYSEDIDTTTEALLFFAARNQSLKNIVIPEIVNGKLVVSDRCFLTSLAYQGAQGANKELLKSLVEHSLSVKPDIIIYMDIDPKIGFERVDSRGERDRIEKKDLSFFESAREEYLKYAESNENVITIDASKDIESVKKEIKEKLSIYIND